MNREETRAFIAKRAARELHNGDVVNLGIGVPSLVSAYLPDDVRVTLHAEDGIVDEGPWPDPSNTEPGYIIDASGRPTSALPGGSYIDSSLSFALMRGGHIDCTVLGALQVDAEGNIANWIIPGKLVPGMGGGNGPCDRRKTRHRRYGTHGQGGAKDHEALHAAADRSRVREPDHHKHVRAGGYAGRPAYDRNQPGVHRGRGAGRNRGGADRIAELKIYGIVRAKHKRPEGEGLQSFRQIFSFLLLSVHKRLCCGVEQRARKGAQTRGTALFTYRQERY